MTTHSSVLAWRIPGTGEPGGLPSVGSHRVGHDWRDLAHCCCSVPKSCLTLCNLMDCSTWGFPVLQCSKSCPLSQWCHPNISPSVAPLFFCPQSFPISGIFQMSWLFKSGDQIIVPSVSASVLPVSIQAWYPLGLTGSISLLSKALSRIFSNTTIWSVVPLSFLNPAYTSGSSWFMCCSLSNVLLRKSGEIVPERMKRQSQSGRDTLLWMCLVVKVKSDFVENNTA